MAKTADKTQTYYAKDRKTWRKWLEKHHTTADHVWLIYYKKDSGKPRVDYADAVEEALCFGWIDTTSSPRDEESYMQLFTPRKSKSVWSKLNKSRVARLTEQGQMMPAGLAAVEVAQKNGMWTSLDAVESYTLPQELEAAFKKHKAAKKFYDSCSNTLRKMVLYYISNAKQAATREKRVAEIIEAMDDGRVPDRYLTPKQLAKRKADGQQ